MPHSSGSKMWLYRAEESTTFNITGYNNVENRHPTRWDKKKIEQNHSLNILWNSQLVSEILHSPKKKYAWNMKNPIQHVVHISDASTHLSHQISAMAKSHSSSTLNSGNHRNIDLCVLPLYFVSMPTHLLRHSIEALKQNKVGDCPLITVGYHSP